MKKTKTLWQHLEQVTAVQNPKYFDTLSVEDKKSWNNWMIFRFLSMNPSWVDSLAEFQPYVQSLEPKQFYLCMIGIVPKGKTWLKYIKGDNDSKFEDWLVDLIKIDYQCSKKQAEEYLEVLYSTKEGKEHIKYVCEKYGTETKKVKKLKLDK